MSTSRKTYRGVVLALALLAGAPAVPGSASAASLPLTGTLDLSSDRDLAVVGPAGSRTGFSVAGAGDFDGDGIPDLVVGAPNHRGPRGEDAGAAWVVFGRRTGFVRRPLDLGAIGDRGLRLDGAGRGDEAGFAVAGVGDVSGDGLADVLVGARLADPAGRQDAGAAYLVYGRRGAGAIDLGALGPGGVTVLGAGTGDSWGFSASGAGDVNGDGRSDLVLGGPRAPNGGAAAVVFTPAQPGTIDLAALGVAGYRMNAPNAPAHAGWSVAGVPDVNGDGRAEVIVGAPFHAPSGRFSGQAYVVFGRQAGGTLDLGALGADGFAVGGAEEWVAGGTVAGLGDLNRDGRGDFGVAAQHASFNERARSGAVFVLFGRPGNEEVDLARLAPAQGFVIQGAAPGDELGAGLAAAGDVNGDGRGDLLIGAPFGSPFERKSAGAAFLVFGGDGAETVDTGLLGSRGFRLAGPATAAVAGRSVAGIGDVNGDGRADMAIGAQNAPRKGRRGAGAAYVVQGPAPSGPDPIESLPPDPGEQEEVRLDHCRAAKTVEAIIDDSGSMAETDPTFLRARALKLLLAKERNRGERLGAVEFGTDANELFPPLLLGTAAFERERRRLLMLIDERVQADNEGTNYNEGFTAARAPSIDADAFIFLTDGEHNAEEYRNRHFGGPRTYVVGLDIGRGGPDGARLQRIADHTRGRYYPSVDDGELQPVLNAIDSRLNCDTDFTTFQDVVTDEGDSDSHVESLGGGTYSADVVLNWPQANDRFAVAGLEYVSPGGRVTARFSGRALRRAARTDRPTRRGRVSVSGRRADTFAAYRVRGIRGGRLRVRVRAVELHGRGRVRTQVAESRRRR